MRNKRVSDVKIGFILDEFSMLCFHGIGDNIYLSIGDWKREILDNNIEVVIIESAWRGNRGQWSGKLTKINGSSEISKLVVFCKERKIPTVFWNKEDPVHFKAFLGLAKIVDYIYTTDRDSINKYKRYIKHERIDHLHFACRPDIHNPIRLNSERKDKLCFAGSYYTCKYDERKEDFDNIMKLSLAYGVDIFDRNKDSNNVRYRFPNRYKKNIVGTLKGEGIIEAYKGYRIMINVNSVKHSSTMFSRRIFECLACGTPIISSYSLGINNYFGKLVCSSDNYFKVKSEIDKLMKDDSYYLKKSRRAVRCVMEEHTVEARILQILDDIGIEVRRQSQGVLIIGVVDSIGEYEKILKSYLRQSYMNTNLLVVIKGNHRIGGRLENQEERVKIIFSDECDDIEKLKRLVSSEYVSFFSPRNYYGENYIKDLVLCKKYSNAKIIGKGCFFSEEKIGIKIEGSQLENRYSDSMELDRCIVQGQYFKDRLLDYKFIYECTEGIEIKEMEKDEVFSSDRFNFIQNYSGAILEEDLGEYLI